MFSVYLIFHKYIIQYNKTLFIIDYYELHGL